MLLLPYLQSSGDPQCSSVSALPDKLNSYIGTYKIEATTAALPVKPKSAFIYWKHLCQDTEHTPVSTLQLTFSYLTLENRTC